MDVCTLLTSGFVSVEYPLPLRQSVVDAMSSWKAFCTLPMEKKRLLSGGDRIRDFGYMRRQDTGPTADDKELFHALRARYPDLLPKAKAVGDRRATDFIEAVDALLIRMGPLVQRFAYEVERHYGLDGFEREVMESQDEWTFRYLHYFGGPTLANAHADRGGLTLHLHESHPGGEYYDGKCWRPWPVSEKETIIFPSAGLQYRSRCVLKALWHRVVSTPETADEGRYSMVCFVDFAMGHRFNDKRFRWQDFSTPGFNYTMPFAEFRKFFVSNDEYETA
jgi:isopenicillin N synthase-like dioxygenase